MPRLSVQEWASARGDYEAGMSGRQVAEKFHVHPRAVQNRVLKEGWTQGEVEPAIRRRVTEQLVGLVLPPSQSGAPRRAPTEISRALSEEAERRVGIIKRHREEWNAARDRLYTGLQGHKLATTQDQKKFAFEDLKAAKITAETLTLIQAGERKAWKLDEPEQGLGPETKIVVEYVAHDSSAP